MAVVKKVKRGGVNFSSQRRELDDEEVSAKPVVTDFSDTSIQEEFEHSPTLDKLAKALVAFRSKCQNLAKDRAAYTARYTTLTSVIDKTQDMLAKHGLCISQFPISGHQSLGVITILMHESGQFIRGRFLMPIPVLKGTSITQNAGAAISYARRYGMQAVLCVSSTDEDTDAVYEEPSDRKPAKIVRKKH